MKSLLYMLMAVLILFSGTATTQSFAELVVAVDIEPDNKFNIFKYKDEGMLTVAVLGTDLLDVGDTNNIPFLDSIISSFFTFNIISTKLFIKSTLFI